MADNFPTFPFTTQEDWYGELTFISAEDGSPLSLEGRDLVMLITPAISGAELIEPKLTLTMGEGGGLALKNGDQSTLIFRVPKETARNLDRMEYTADILEVADANRYLFMPTRIQYIEPSSLRNFLSRFLGVKVSFSARRQPIVTPVAVAGREGRPGATIINGTAPPTSVVGKDGDFFIEDRTATSQGRRMYGPKVGGEWPGTPWSIQVAGVSDVPGLTDELSAKASRDDLTAPKIKFTWATGTAQRAVQNKLNEMYPSQADYTGTQVEALTAALTTGRARVSQPISVPAPLKVPVGAHLHFPSGTGPVITAGGSITNEGVITGENGASAYIPYSTSASFGPAGYQAAVACTVKGDGTGANLNGIVGAVRQNNAAGQYSFPCGIIAYGEMNSPGNSVFPLFVRGDLNAPGSNPSEFNSFNFSGPPSKTFPLANGFGTTENVGIGVQSCAGGTFGSTAAFYAAQEGSQPQTWVCAYYSAPAAITDYGVFIDANASAGPQISALLRNKGGASNCTLQLETTGAAVPTAPILQHRNAAGTVTARMTQAGALALGEAGDGNLRLAVAGSATDRGMSGVAARFGVTIADGSIGAGVQIGSVNGNAPFIGASQYNGTTATPLAFYTDNIERMRISQGGGGLAVGTTDTSGARIKAFTARVGDFALHAIHSGAADVVSRAYASASSYTGTVARVMSAAAAGTGWNLLDGFSADGADRKFVIRGDGALFADVASLGSPADYAEFFESATGGDIEPGTSVVLDGERVRPATEDDAATAILGVIRPKDANTSLVCNTADLSWSGKYLSDAFGRTVEENVEFVRWVETPVSIMSVERQVTRREPDAVEVERFETIDGQARRFVDMEEIWHDVPVFHEEPLFDASGAPIIEVVEPARYRRVRGPDIPVTEPDGTPAFNDDGTPKMAPNVVAELVADAVMAQRVLRTPVMETVEERVEGEPIVHEVRVRDLGDVVPPADAERFTVRERVLNPDYDPDAVYVPRRDRSEWVIVGLVGQVELLAGQPVGDRWRKMRDLGGGLERWMIR